MGLSPSGPNAYISNAKVMDDFPENLIDLVTDYWFQTIFKEMSLEWSAVMWFSYHLDKHTCVVKAFLAMAFIKTG